MAKSEWVSFKLHGLKEMREALAAVDADIRHKAARDAGKAALKHVYRRVYQNVPVKFGDLKKTVRLSATNRPTRRHSKKAFMVARVTAGSPNFRGSSPQAIQLEYGTSSIKARRFMRNAIEGKERNVLSLFAHHLGKATEKAALKQYRRNNRKIKKRLKS